MTQERITPAEYRERMGIKAQPKGITAAEYRKRHGLPLLPHHTPAKPTRARATRPKPTTTRTGYSEVITDPPTPRVATTTSWAIRFTIEDRPASKKNGKEMLRIKGKPKFVENARYQRWERSAIEQLGKFYTAEPITEPVRMSLVIYEHPMQRGDLAGIFQGVCDMLQKAGVLKNDRLVRGSGTMDILRDRDRPRIEITLTNFEPLNG